MSNAPGHSRAMDRSPRVFCALWFVGMGVLCGCVQVPPPTSAGTEAEAAKIARSVIPITSPLHLQYRPTPPIRLQMEMSMNGQAVVGRGTASMEVHSFGKALRISVSICSLEAKSQAQSQILNCGRDPLISVNQTISQDGHVISSDLHPTPGCEASKYFADTLGMFTSLLGSYSVLPPEGVTSGATLVLDSIQPISTTLPGQIIQRTRIQHVEVRLIVAGQTDWYGRPVLVTRYGGCTLPETGREWEGFCPHGVAIIDLASGFPIGGIIFGEEDEQGVRTTTTMRLHPE